VTDLVLVKPFEGCKMFKRETDSTFMITLPLWKVMLVLVGLPAFYIANSLMPWSIGLLRRHDHAFFLQFWTSIAILHWGSVALVVVTAEAVGQAVGRDRS